VQYFATDLEFAGGQWACKLHASYSAIFLFRPSQCDKGLLQRPGQITVRGVDFQMLYQVFFRQFPGQKIRVQIIHCFYVIAKEFCF